MYKESDLINRVELFDEFVSDKFGAGKKNIAFHLDLQHQERTLTDKEVDDVVKNIVEKIKSRFKAELRTY
jgi:phenylalanyl-tRNA synthetase beta chain